MAINFGFNNNWHTHYHSIPTNAIHRTIYQLLISTIIFFSKSLTNTYIYIFTVEIADELNSAFKTSCDSDDDYDTDCNDCDSQNSSQSDSSEHKVNICFIKNHCSINFETNQLNVFSCIGFFY